ncbi:MAG: SBBP repeat-containing protein, partial [Desulfobacterales bacterium]
MKLKSDLTRCFKRRDHGARIFVLIIGLLTLFYFYEGVAHAEAVYLFTKTMGGTDQDIGRSVAVDGSGNIYITGSFQGTVDFNFTPGGVPDSHTAVLDDIFLTKINADGSYGYTKTMGGTDQDIGQSVAVDGSDNV